MSFAIKAAVQRTVKTANVFDCGESVKTDSFFFAGASSTDMSSELPEKRFFALAIISAAVSFALSIIFFACA